MRPRIQKRVGALLGAEPMIMFRTVREIEAIVRAAPFGTLVGNRAVKLYVMFLALLPARRPVLPRSRVRRAS